MNSDLPLFPEQASRLAPEIDALYLFLIGVAVFFTALICCLILYFVIRYRRTADVNRANPPTSQLLELSWAVVPFIITMVIFFWGAALFSRQHQPPDDADEIAVVGKQWMWKIQHSNGKQEINNLHVPVGRPIRLTMISEDVIHSFFIPAFRVKQDVLPGRYTSMWFEATKPGRYHLFCAEYCGTSHSQMGGWVTAMEPSAFAEWLRGDAASTEPPEVSGEQLFTQLRCNTCHQANQLARCPNLEGVFGRPVQLADGRTITADEAYLRESILEPNAKVVAGYPANMPTYKGQISEQDLFRLIAYLKSLDPPGSQPDTPPTSAREPASPETPGRSSAAPDEVEPADRTDPGSSETEATENGAAETGAVETRSSETGPAQTDTDPATTGASDTDPSDTDSPEIDPS